MTLLAFLFGLLVGSFLNVCIHRWPLDESVVQPRSRCPACGAPIAWYDNIPFVSFLLLRGRCRACRARISWRYPAVELLNAALFAAVVAKFGVSIPAAKAAVFGSMMLVLIFTDIEHYILPDEITLGGLALGLAISPLVALPAGPVDFVWMLAGGAPSWRLVSFLESAAAALLFGGMLWGLGAAYERLRGKQDALGLGDVKMAAMMGSFWGIGPTLAMVLLGSVGGALVGTALVLFGGRRWDHGLPFGSYLGAAALLVTLWRDDLFELYFRIIDSSI